MTLFVLLVDSGMLPPTLITIVTVFAHIPAPGAKACPAIDVTVAVHSGAVLAGNSELVCPPFCGTLFVKITRLELVDTRCWMLVVLDVGGFVPPRSRVLDRAEVVEVV